MMKLKLSCIIGVLVLVAVFNIFSQTPPPYKQPSYFPEDWRGEGFPFADDAYPDSGLFAITDMNPNEPLRCYPFHSGHVIGISDTVALIVRFKNYNTEPYDISTMQPETWFTPLLYRYNDNPRKSHPITDTSHFNVSFRYWENGVIERVTKPQAIPSSFSSTATGYALVYYVWNLPVGRNRLLMKATTSAPPGFRTLISNRAAVWVTKPTDLGDTLNAYGACFWRAFDADDYTGALVWVDSMLTHNQYSIPGYLLKAYAHSDLGDSLAKVTALDSAIAIAERYGDPVVPDTSKMGMYWKMWYDDILSHIKFYRWKHITGNEKMMNL